MDQRFSGLYLKAGTRALIEDTGLDGDVGSDPLLGTNRSLVFDPLLLGPGASGLAMAYVYVSPTLDINDANAVMLSPEFAASGSDLAADTTRRYAWYPWLNLEDFHYVMIYDFFFETLISVGTLQLGPDVVASDAGIATEAGITMDAGSQESGMRDQGLIDILVADSGALDVDTVDVTIADIDNVDITLADVDPTDIAPMDGGVNDLAGVDTSATADAALRDQ